jgi:hypothetical protein
VWGKRDAYRVMVGNLMERDDLEDLGIDWTIIIKCILKKWNGRHELDCLGSGQGQVAGAHAHRNEPSGSITCEEFELLRTC